MEEEVGLEGGQRGQVFHVSNGIEMPLNWGFSPKIRNNKPRWKRLCSEPMARGGAGWAGDSSVLGDGGRAQARCSWLQRARETPPFTHWLTIHWLITLTGSRGGRVRNAGLGPGSPELWILAPPPPNCGWWHIAPSFRASVSSSEGKIIPTLYGYYHN